MILKFCHLNSNAIFLLQLIGLTLAQDLQQGFTTRCDELCSDATLKLKDVNTYTVFFTNSFVFYTLFLQGLKARLSKRLPIL